MRSPHIAVAVNLDYARASAEAIKRRSRVKLIAVVKADAYGLGAPRVADALASVVDEFAYFALEEAQAIGRPGLLIGPPFGTADEFRAAGVRPAVGTLEAAERYRGLRVAISVDTGMQRFGCRPDALDALVPHCDVSEYMAHTVTVEAALRLKAACGQRGRPIHAAASSLLDHPEVWFDAVRPGVALFRGAMQVTTRLALVRETQGAVGYTGFTHSPVGVILGGYSNRLAPGAPLLINGRRQHILETGMNTSYVSADPADRIGDPVVLLGTADDGSGQITEQEVAAALHIREHEVLCRYGAAGERTYMDGR